MRALPHALPACLRCMLLGMLCRALHMSEKEQERARGGEVCSVNIILCILRRARMVPELASSNADLTAENLRLNDRSALVPDAGLHPVSWQHKWPDSVPAALLIPR